MRLRRAFIAVLAAVMLMAVCACTGATTESAGGMAIPAKPEGAATAEELFNCAVDYLKSGCDANTVAGVHDQKAFVAYYIQLLYYEGFDKDVPFDECLKKADLLYGDGDTLRAQDPELADMIMEELDALEPEEAVTEYLDQLRQQFKDGAITEDHPNYEKLNQILSDADKGTDYIYENYPEVFDRDFPYQAVGLDNAMEQFRYIGSLAYDRDFLVEHFRDADFKEFRPENVYTDSTGTSAIEIATAIDGGGAYYADMVYYYDGRAYYLICFDTAVGGIGG